MATTDHSPKLLWVCEMQAMCGHSTWRRGLMVDMVVALGWNLCLVILMVFSNLNNPRILWCFLFCIFYIANTLGFVISCAFKKKSEENFLSQNSVRWSLCTQTHIWCRRFMRHKWQNLHWHLRDSGSFPYFQINHVQVHLLVTCVWAWNPCLPNNQLLLPTICVPATALGVCLCKDIICQRPRKPQGNKSLAPRTMQDLEAPDPNPAPHCSANTSFAAGWLWPSRAVL